jgi:hypothetical protein
VNFFPIPFLREGFFILLKISKANVESVRFWVIDFILIRYENSTFKKWNKCWFLSFLDKAVLE